MCGARFAWFYNFSTVFRPCASTALLGIAKCASVKARAMSYKIKFGTERGASSGAPLASCATASHAACFELSFRAPLATPHQPVLAALSEVEESLITAFLIATHVETEIAVTSFSSGT